MRALRALAAVATAAVLLAPGTSGAERAPCPPDSVRAGTVCIDKYEASLWNVPGPTTTNRKLVRKIQAGTATLEDLTEGAAQILAPPIPSLPEDGSWAALAGAGAPTIGVYAVSVPGVVPIEVTWFQADQACALSGKRLPTSYEWQVATAGTPDPEAADDGVTTCNTLVSGLNPTTTGTRSACVSAWGAFDTIGNVAEWVAEWVEPPANSDDQYLGDTVSFGGPGTTSVPNGLIRGGRVLQIFSSVGSFYAVGVSFENASAGFRCAR